MRLESYIIEELSNRAGCDVTTTAGATTLCYDIEKVTGERLSLNTVKRLTGVLQYKSASRVSTLDIIARYLGFESWRLYVANGVSVIPHTSAFVKKDRYITMRNLPEGQQVAITWAPKRLLKIRHKGAGCYEVEESVNGKLRTGDLIQLAEIGEGSPLIALEVERSGISLGSYVSCSRVRTISML